MKKIISLIYVFISVLLNAQTTSSVCFNAPSSASSQTGTNWLNSIISGDYNNDGIKDVITANQHGVFSVLFGTGFGTFDPPVHYHVGSITASDLASSDLNGDGNLDLLFSTSQNVISVFLGSSSGSFTPAFNYTLAYTCGSRVIADFNSDSFKDIAVATGNKVIILCGTGTGSFSSVLTHSLSYGSAGSIIASDFNNDGKMDVATVNSSNKISVLTGLGTGYFNTPIYYTPGSGPTSIISADINGDGKLDLAVANSGDDNVSILMGFGTGTFGTPTHYMVGIYPENVIAADFNSDGIVDLATANSTTNDISVLLGVGSGSFFASVDYASGRMTKALTVSDFNGDGNMDIVAANYGNKYVTTFLGIGNGEFTGVKSYDVGYNNQVISGDFNGDGNIDLASPTAVSLGTGNSTFGSPIYFTAGNQPLALVSGDFNGDNKLDLAVSDLFSNKIYILIGNGLGSFSNLTNYSLSSYASWLIKEDVNSDGIMDLIASKQNSNSISVLLGLGGGYFANEVSYPVGAWPTQPVIADVNMDGKKDIVVTNRNSGDFSVLLGTGSGSFLNSVNYNLGWGNTLFSVTANDFNNDGKPDLGIAAKQSPPNLFILNGVGDGTFLTPTSYSLPVGPCNIISKDFNNDGNIDLAIDNNDSSLVSVLTGSGTGAFNFPVNYWVNKSPVSLIADDFNGDGGMDIVTKGMANPYPHIRSLGVLINGMSNISITSPNEICTGNATTLTASGVSQFYWSNGSMLNPIIVSPTVTTSYSVTNVSLNGCISMAARTVSVSQTPTISIASSANALCVGSSCELWANGVNSYTWSTGAITYSVSVTPTVSSIYSVTGSNACGAATETISIMIDNTCAYVWPGDANSDGTADNVDILELGTHYIQTGPARLTTNNSWQSWFSSNWSGTITNGKNLNHSDCNGDGTINDNDTLAIFNNYGLTHAFKGNQQTVTNPQISIVPDQVAVIKGTWGTASVYLGDAIASINNINGVAFTVNFDNTLIETNSVWIEYPTSFINLSNQNLHFRKLDFGNSNLYTATTHTVNNNVSGNGLIAKLHYQIKSTLSTDEVLNLGITNASQGDASGLITPLTSGTGTLMAIGSSVGIKESLTGNLITISPNPANSNVLIASTTDLEKVEVINLTGQVLISELTSEKTHRLNVETLANGVYFVKAYSGSKQVVLKKLVIQK